MLPHSHDVLAVAFRPDGKQVACATLDGQLHLWDPLEGELQVLLSVLRIPVHPLLCVYVAVGTHWLALVACPGTSWDEITVYELSCVHVRCNTPQLFAWIL